MERLNHYSKYQIPCLFVINYKKTLGLCIPISEIDKNEIDFSINTTPTEIKATPLADLVAFPISFENYLKKFNTLQSHIQQGDTYLCNLTQETPIRINLTLKEIFQASQARYKLWIKDQFVVFSPEPFITIENGHIYTFPMKGTADATQDNTLQELLNDPKENAEHNTIVDLLRNDLSIVAKQVEVTRLKYIDKIKTHKGELLQMSTEIRGQLRPSFQNNYGNLFNAILPAGSISGAPKRKTLEIIDAIEGYERGFYTGIFGVYDGSKLTSAVMIRFIENTESGYVYKSGGGITALSEPHSEYLELIHKIYVPVF